MKKKEFCGIDIQCRLRLFAEFLYTLIGDTNNTFGLLCVEKRIMARSEILRKEQLKV